MSERRLGMRSARPLVPALRSIQFRLAALFSIVFLMILLATELASFWGVPGTSLTGRIAHYRQEAVRSMSLIADLKEERLRWWLHERQRDLHMLVVNRSREAQVRQLAATLQGADVPRSDPAVLAKSLRSMPVYDELMDRLAEIQAIYEDYHRIFVVEPRTGIVMGSTRVGDVGINVSNKDYFAIPARDGRAFVSEVRWAKDDDCPVIDFSDVFFAPDRSMSGIMVIEMRTEKALLPLLHTGEGLGSRGEALLVDQSARILASLKYPLPDGSNPRPTAHQLTTEAATRAAEGQQGVVDALDYRQVPVVAAYRFVRLTPDLGWGLVVKRDREELMSPLRAEMYDAIWLAVTGIVVIVVVAIAVARRFTRPVRALAKTANAVAVGDLSARAPVITRDEVGVLAADFNAMIQQIQESQEALLRQERLAALGRLTATVSHEIRNPLGTIRSSMFMLRQQLQGKSPGVETALERIERNVTRCDTIISELLEYGCNRRVQREPTEMHRWLCEVLDDFEMPAKVVLVRELQTKVWAAVDRERFRRVMVNLLNNACQAMEPRGGRVTVWLRCEEGRVSIMVCDTGCGISPDALERVFETLYSTKSFGVGLGLAIVRQIVHQHHGEIEVASRLGQGTEFKVWLPSEAEKETT